MRNTCNLNKADFQDIVQTPVQFEIDVWPDLLFQDHLRE